MAAWALALGGACTIALCVFADMTWEVIIGSYRGLTKTDFSESLRKVGVDLAIEQSSQVPTGSVKTLSDILRMKQLPRTLLTHSDVDFCPNTSEPAADDLQRVPEEVKMLMLIGTQKAGTTWLFQALDRHPSFTSASRRPGGDAVERGSLRAKEPQFFNRWPLPPVEQYLRAWQPADVAEMVAGTAGTRVLLDASPQYLMSAAAPARIQAAVPHARFIIVVRDAPIRTFSDFKMRTRQPDCSGHSTRLCPKSSFLEQVHHELREPRWEPECFFNDSDVTATWWDCHRCHFGYINQTESRDACAELLHSGPPDFRDCSRPSHRFIDQGLYAPQLAWWLCFFPPERFLIISSWQLRDEVERIKVLNRVIDFAGLAGAGAPPFTAAMVDGVAGFPGRYSREWSDEVTAALGLLREYFRKPQQDLVRLVNTFWPADDFRIEYET